MGSEVSSSTQDSLPIRLFLNRWFEKLVSFPDVGERDFEQARSEFGRALDRHNRRLPDANAFWGWKNPRSMWLLPFYLQLYPNLKFVHVVRDARDMALSSNMFLLNKHGDYLLTPLWRKNPAVAQMALWARGNMQAATAAEKCMPGNYLLLRYEDMCRDKEETLGKLLNFLGAARENVDMDELVGMIRPSGGIGRGETSQETEVAALDPDVSAALGYFRYT